MNENGKVKSFRELLVWQKGIELAKAIYSLTQQFPNEEKFGLVSQLRRAAVSVPSNIAEGQSRRSSAEFSQFISISLGSLAELETQLVRACPSSGPLSETRRNRPILDKVSDEVSDKGPKLRVLGQALVITSELRIVPREQIESLIARIHELQKMLHPLRSKLATH